MDFFPDFPAEVKGGILSNSINHVLLFYIILLDKVANVLYICL